MILLLKSTSPENYPILLFIISTPGRQDTYRHSHVIDEETDAQRG